MKTQYHTIADDALYGAAGGLSAPGWADYLSAQVLPILNGLVNSAAENDRVILQNICRTLKDTSASDAGAALEKLWVTYNIDYRPALQSGKIRTTLDQKLYSARHFADSLR